MVFLHNIIMHEILWETLPILENPVSFGEILPIFGKTVAILENLTRLQNKQKTLHSAIPLCHLSQIAGASDSISDPVESHLKHKQSY